MFNANLDGAHCKYTPITYVQRKCRNCTQTHTHTLGSSGHLNDRSHWLEFMEMWKKIRLFINCVFDLEFDCWSWLKWLLHLFSCHRKLTFKPIVQFISRSHNAIYHKFIINIFCLPWFRIASTRKRTGTQCVICDSYNNTVDRLCHTMAKNTYHPIQPA